MKVACVGGGPASLYFAILMKRIDPSHDITVYERNRAGSTYGWGVTYSNELTNNLFGADPESARAISESSQRWNSWSTRLRDRTTVKTSRRKFGLGIGRSRLLDILAERARELGAHIEYEREIAAEEELGDVDLILAGDGINSGLRDRHTDHFGTEVAVGRNLYTWLGTTKVFDAFTYAFVETEHGWIWCYGYQYSEDHSTCVIECAPQTWRGLGFEANNSDTLTRLAEIFVDTLDGEPLIGRADGTAHWLAFRTLTNRTWHRNNLVLAGDAAHSTHFSVGAGTALALGDAAILVDALHRDLPLAKALSSYERESKSAIAYARRVASRSARWYESLPRYADLPPEVTIALFKKRYSAVLPYVSPQLYYQCDQARRSLRSTARDLRAIHRGR